MSDFVHLHLHSEYSLLDGACRIKSIVKKAKESGHSAVAVTDHGNMYAAVEFYNECKKEGIKPIIGCEVYVAPRSRFDKTKIDLNPYHLILLCENNEGYKNLIKLVSLASVEGFYNRPRVDVDILRQYSKGLICLSGCLAGEVSRRLSNNDYEGAKETVLLYKDIFGKDNYFIEIQNHLFEDEERILPFFYKLSYETGVSLVATNDVHYLDKKDAKMQQVLMCVSTATTIDDPKAMRFPTEEFYYKSKDEMLSLFPNHPEVVENTVKIAQRCNVTFEFGVTKLPKFKLEGVEDNCEFFKKLCVDGAYKRYGEKLTKEVEDRLFYELSVISQMGYVDYYLIVWDFINFAKTNDIPVGPGRGSGAGSLCAYCMEITDIDPIRYNLLFERFLNPERVSMPDFDIDFCIVGRQRVIDYVVKRYGSDHVSQIATFGTLKARAAIRDVARTMGVPYSTADTVAKMIPQDLHITISKALSSVKELKELYDSDKTVREVVDTAAQIEGMPRQFSVHAAGIVITQLPVTEYVPLQSNDGQIVTQYTMTVLESLGLLKFDFLGLRNLTVIHDCEESIRKIDKSFDIGKIPLDDKAVFDMLTNGDTSGVFQFESAGMTAAIMKLKPERLEDLIAVVSLYRPGPMDSIPTYIRNRHNPSLVTYKHPLLKSILSETYGCIVYQEQVMQVCRVLAGYSYGRADIVRRAMAKKKYDVMEKERQAFIYGDKNPDGSVNCVGALKNGVDEKTANEIFDEMISFASYAFNKSHAAAYALVAYRTAYEKVHYYKDYMSALMTSVLDSTSKIIEYASECESKGIKLLTPDINLSDEGFSAEKDGIRFGLLAVKSLGRGVIRNIISEREKNGPFKTVQDFIDRMYGQDVNARAIEALIKCGAFDSFPSNRRQMLQGYDVVMSNVAAKNKNSMEGQLDFFSMGDKDTTYGDMELPYVEEFDYEELLAMEKETTGIYISGHPSDGYSAIISASKLNSVAQIIKNTSENVLGFSDGKEVSIIAQLQSMKLHTTKSNSRMCFAVLEDKTGDIECIVFPNVFERMGKALSKNGLVFVKGRISLKDDEDAKIIAEFVCDVNEYVDMLKRKTLYLKLNTTDMEKIEAVKKVCRENIGESKVLFYFENLKKTASIKDLGITVSNNVLKELSKIVGDKNIAFKQ